MTDASSNRAARSECSQVGPFGGKCRKTLLHDGDCSFADAIPNRAAKPYCGTTPGNGVGSGIVGGLRNVPDATRNRAANPYNEALRDQELQQAYERGRKDGYDEAVKMIRRATQALQRKRKAAT
jgi:hypothetical protein